MFITKQIVSKLWMTIILLVAFVLLILGLFLFRYIDTTFPKFDGQRENLGSLAEKISAEIPFNERDNGYIRAMNDLLGAQDTGVILLEKGLQERTFQNDKPLHAKDIYSQGELDRVLSGEKANKTFIGETPRGKGDYLAVAVPVIKADTSQILGAVILYQPLQSVEALQLYVKKIFAFVSAVGFLLTTFFAFFLITRITRPLIRLRQAVGRIAQGKYGGRVPVQSTDEIGELAQTFNLMSGDLEETIKDLNNEKENLASVLGSMEDAVISFDTDGNVIFTNPYGERVFEEWSAIQWAEKDPEEPAWEHQIPEPLVSLFDEVVEETKVINSKLHVHNEVWSVVMAPLYSAKEVRGAVAVLRDVTEESRLEKLRKDFVANVSHELRTPLSMLQGYSEALLDDIAGTPEQRKELAQIIHDESLRMGRLVKDLLDLARMEAGHMEMNMGVVPLAPLFHRVQRKFFALCKERNIQVECDLLDGNIILQEADQDRLEQVLTNLLDNAIRHTPEGKYIFLRLQLMSHNDETAALIEIEDEGRGIPPEDLPYIFERFYKADKARTRGNSVGTGLGLAIVKNIVEAHRGSVNVRSVVGHGTTFSIIIPTQKEHE